MKSLKLLAAAILLSCGLGLGVGAGLLPVAEAQPRVSYPAPKAPKADPEAEVKRLQAELLKALQDLAAAKKAEEARKSAQDEMQRRALRYLESLSHAREETYTVKTKKWEYDFVEVSDMGPTAFGKFLQDREGRGWEFNGHTPLQVHGKASGVWVFRRPARSTPPATSTPSPPR